jgi:hypothetical protein
MGAHRQPGRALSQGSIAYNSTSVISAPVVSKNVLEAGRNLCVLQSNNRARSSSVLLSTKLGVCFIWDVDKTTCQLLSGLYYSDWMFQTTIGGCTSCATIR